MVANAAAEGDARQVVVDSQADDKVQSRNAKKTYLAQKGFSADNQDRIRYKSTSEANRVTLENLKSALAGKFGDPVAQGVYRSLFDAKVVSYQKRNGTEVQTYRPVSAAEIMLADQLASALSQARASAISAATEAGETAGVTPAHVDAAINELVTGDDALDLVAGNELSTEGLQQFREQLGQKLASIAESRQAFEARFQTALLLLELDNQQGLPDQEGQTARQVAINERTLQLRAAPESRGKGRGVIFPEVKTAHDQPKTVDANQLHGVSEAKIYQRGERSAAAIQHEREVHNRQTLPETLALEHADIAIANARKELDSIPQLELELDHIRLLAASGLDVIHALEDEITGLEQQLRDLTEVAVGADDKEALTLQLASAKQALDRLRSGVDHIDNLESERQELDERANDLGRRLLEVESTESDLSTEREQLLQR